MTGEHVIYGETAGFPAATEDISTPDSQLAADLDRLTLITRARTSGATWNQIGATLGLTGREAKRHARHLARRTGQAWRLQQNQETAP